MLASFVFFLLGITPLVNGYTRFSIRDCTNSENRIVTIENAHVRNYPITIPGNIYPSGTLNILRPGDDFFRLDVTVQKFFFYDYLTIPCINRVGSCSYDYCGLLDWFQDPGCPWQLRASGVPCTCPFTNGTYTLQPFAWYIYPLNRAWAWLAMGDYRVNGRLTDTRTDEEIACFDVEFTAQQRQDDDWWWNW